jgi:hypothetical protein
MQRKFDVDAGRQEFARQGEKVLGTVYQVGEKESN